MFFCSIKALKPVDATTNPSLILAAVTQPKFAELVDTAIKSAKGATADEKYDDGLHHPILNFCPSPSHPVPMRRK
jgi:transaldolase